jgi:hypothetical protein
MAIQGEQTERTCDQCFFRRAGLCALTGNVVCPTFRAVEDVRLARLKNPPPERRAAPRRTPTPA